MAMPPTYQPPPYGPPPPANQLSVKQKSTLGCGGLFLTLVAIGTIAAACSPSPNVTTKAVPGPTVTETVTVTAVVTPAAGATAKAPTTPAPRKTPKPEPTGRAGVPATTRAQLPNLVGQQLQAAQDAAQAAGFAMLTSHDATGEGRLQLLDRNWRVCSQSPRPGLVDTSATVDFGTVKIGETCP